MNWITHYDGTDWKIENNCYNSVEFEPGKNRYYFFRYGKSFLRITMKTAGEKTITVGNENYTFYWANEFIIVEITDLIRAFTDGNIAITATGLSSIIYYASVSGSSADDFMSKLPKEIPFNTASTNPFWVCITYVEKSKETLGCTLLAPTLTSKMLSFNWRSERSLYGMKPFLVTVDGVYTNFTKPCWGEMILVGGGGKLKSWWFEIDSMLLGSDKTLLQTLEDGYNTMKNKRVSFRVKHQRADNITQHYLSDIVISDEVYVYDGTDKLQVRVSDNTFEVTKVKRDITINK